MKELYDLDDITLIPRTVNCVEHREKYPLYANKIYIAPMSSIVDTNNIDLFNTRTTAILPRNIDFTIRIEFCRKGYMIAVGLEELEKIIENKYDLEFPRVLLDIANGHMLKAIKLCKKFKDTFPDGISMAGNIANPRTLIDYTDANIDYVRIGIGSGSRCITSSNTGVYYGMGSLIKECVSLKLKLSRAMKAPPTIIADGGFNTPDRIIKAFALGADAVMCGNLFARCLEACGNVGNEFLNKNSLVLDEEAKRKLIRENTYYRDYYGMSTKIAQKECNKEELKTSEGILKPVKIEYTYNQLMDNLQSNVASALSYCDCTSLRDFPYCVEIAKLTEAARNQYYK